MRKRPAQAIPFTYFIHSRHDRPGGRPPLPEEKLFDRLFTSLARSTGLTRHARSSIVRQIEQIELSAASLKMTDRVQHLHRQLNTVVDGGWRGLWTSIRVALGAA